MEIKLSKDSNMSGFEGNPADMLDSWRSGHISSGKPIKAEANIPECGKRTQSGNRCGHNKNKLRVPLCYRKISKRAKHPHSIEEAIRVIRKTVYWLRAKKTKRKALLKAIQPDVQAIYAYKRILSLFQEDKFRRLFFHYSKNTKSGWKRKRSDGIESLILFTLSTLLNYVDLPTMAIGIRHNASQFDFKDSAWIAEKAGCSLSRVNRALHWLAKAGLVLITPITKKIDDGHIITLGTQIHLSEDVFFLLGLKDQYLEDRKYALKKVEEARLRKEEKERRLEKSMSHDMAFRKKNLKKLGKIFNNSPLDKKPTYFAKPIYNPASDKEVLSLAKSLMDSRQYTSIRDAINAACMRLGKPPPH